MDISFTPGVPNDPAKAAARMKKMQEASAKLGDDGPVFNLQEDAAYVAEAMKCALTNYGTKKITEDLKTGPADPSKKNVKPMKCTKCQYHGEPANDGKCKECGGAMVPMMTNTEDFPAKDDAEVVPPPLPVDSSGQPANGGQNAGGAPPMPGMPGMSPMPPGEPDDGKDDDFDPSDQPEVGEMVAYAVARQAGAPIRGRAGRVMLVFRGEASIDTGRKDRSGRAVTDKVPVALLSRIPESILGDAAATHERSVDTWGAPSYRPQAARTESRVKSKAQKLIEQVANGRRTADQAVEALFS